jgi:hypothetical protein
MVFDCSHWYASCTKCGARYHHCLGTTQCDNCRVPVYRWDWETMQLVLDRFKDSPFDLKQEEPK